ncbi:MAG TPA: hypothetical protein VGN52_15610 [Burkholderiales bacterium]
MTVTQDTHIAQPSVVEFVVQMRQKITFKNKMMARHVPKVWAAGLRFGKKGWVPWCWTFTLGVVLFVIDTKSVIYR